MIGIIDWRMAQCAARDVDFRFNTWAEPADVLALNPGVVVVATGGLPDTDVLAAGGDLVVSAWDILAGDVRPGADVLVYDDAGDHAALQAAEVIAATGAKVEVMTPERSFAIEVMGMNLTPYMRALQPRGVKFTVTWRLLSARREGNRIVATIGSDYFPGTREATYDQIVVNHATLPNDDLYFALKPLSKNRGRVDEDALAESRAQPEAEGEGFTLWRIGDAVSARNIHAAIYDALRLMKGA